MNWFFLVISLLLSPLKVEHHENLSQLTAPVKGKSEEIRFVNLNQGVYKVSSPILISDNTILNGNNSVLILEDEALCPVIVIGDLNTPSARLTQNVWVQNLKIVGNKKNQSNELSKINPNLRNNGITVRNSRNVILQSIYLTECRSGGLVTEKNSSFIFVKNLVATKNYFDGVGLCETQFSVFENLILENNDYAGLTMDWNADNNLFLNSKFRNNKHQGAFIRMSQNVAFANIDMLDNWCGAGFVFHVNDDPNTACKNIYFKSCKIDKLTISDFCQNVQQSP